MTVMEVVMNMNRVTKMSITTVIFARSTVTDIANILFTIISYLLYFFFPKKLLLAVCLEICSFRKRLYIKHI